jgi:hypothetical protein
MNRTLALSLAAAATLFAAPFAEAAHVDVGIAVSPGATVIAQRPAYMPSYRPTYAPAYAPAYAPTYAPQRLVYAPPPFYAPRPRIWLPPLPPLPRLPWGWHHDHWHHDGRWSR